ncbi:MAG: DUF4162 domain-containing protein, partial [Anaerolineales bacterium]
SQLKREWLGPPVLELRVARPLNGLADSLQDLVKVVATGDDWLRYEAEAPQVMNPRVLQRLAGQQVPVVTLSEVPRSLEDVYLQVVGGSAELSLTRGSAELSLTRGTAIDVEASLTHDA